jgi:hypothetical protein
MAGNTLVIKHADCVRQCAIAFETLFLDAGAPPGLYTNLLISHAQSYAVIDDARIKGVALTGSTAAGRGIAARAGQNLKPSSMESGGSDAFIVLEDADMDHTVKWAVSGRMYNDNQTSVPGSPGGAGGTACVSGAARTRSWSDRPPRSATRTTRGDRGQQAGHCRRNQVGAQQEHRALRRREA